jgi:hypothetical protein
MCTRRATGGQVAFDPAKVEALAGTERIGAIACWAFGAG